MISFETVVPEGLYFADDEEFYSYTKIKAIQWTAEIGEALAKKHPEMADLYRDREQPKTYMDIAKIYIPDIADRYPSVAKKAVGEAVRRLIPESEQQELTAFHQAHSIEKWCDFGSEEFRKQCTEAWRIRQGKYGTPVEALIRGRGQIPWSEEEKARLLELSDDPHYQHLRGRPNYKKIAEALDSEFHSSKGIRNQKTVRNYSTDYWRKKRKGRD